MARCGESFSPQSPNENEVYGFDFVDDVQPGEVIQSITSWTISVLSGSDTEASTRLVGSPTIDATTPTIARQRVVGLQPGVRYLMTCLVVTSLGNKVELSGVAPGKSS